MEGVNKIKEISSIPEGWRVSKLKYFATGQFKGNGITKDDIVDNGEIGCVRYADLYTKYNYHFSECEVRTDRSKVAVPRYFTYGALLFACTGELVEEIGKSVVYLGKDKCLAGGDLYVVNHAQDPQFMAYAMESAYIRFQKSSGKSKLKVVHISSDEINNLLVILPPYFQQKRVAAFLNKKCSEIDFISSDIQKEIETLEAYKRSLITEAVTKGLDKSVLMKNSGIPWIGNIPQHWDVIANKYIMHKKKDICAIYRGEEILSLTMNGVIVRDFSLGGKVPASFDGYQKVYPGNLLMCLFDIDVTPRCIGLVKNNGLVSPAYSQFVLHENADAKYYYYYYLMLDFTKELLHLAKNLRHSLTEDQLGVIKVPVPPIIEQKKIANFLDSKSSEIDAIITSKKQQLETLATYKKSLIYEYVTGKKEVK